MHTRLTGWDVGKEGKEANKEEEPNFGGRRRRRGHAVDVQPSQEAREHRSRAKQEFPVQLFSWYRFLDKNKEEGGEGKGRPW